MKLKPTAVVVMIRTNYSETKTHETHPQQLHNETLEVIAAQHITLLLTTYSYSITHTKDR